MSEKTKANLLIVDDESSIRSTLARILQGMGCTVITAGSGMEALRRINSEPEPIELVILDLRMPDMNGIDLLREIRKVQPRIPAILLTAHGSLNTAMDAMQLGAVDYLLKPVRPDVLVQRTQKILRKIEFERRRVQIQNQILHLQTELNQIEHLLADHTAANDFNPKESFGQLAEAVGNKPSRYIVVGDLRLDLQARRINLAQLSGDETQIELPPSSYDYLVVLARHVPDTVTYQDLVAEAQGYQANITQARELTKWHIHHLRQAISSIPHSRNRIINVRGIGYRLVVD